MEERMIYEACLRLWGAEAQLGQLQEECAELIVAASKYKRGAADGRERLTEELADVQNMINQITLLCDAGMVERIRWDKLLRLVGILERGKSSG